MMSPDSHTNIFYHKRKENYNPTKKVQKSETVRFQIFYSYYHNRLQSSAG